MAKKRKATDEMLDKAIESVKKRWDEDDRNHPNGNPRWLIHSIQVEVHNNDICGYDYVEVSYTVTGKRIIERIKTKFADWFPCDLEIR